MANTIIIKDYTKIQGEAIANAEIYPGHLIEILSTGKVQKHATIGGRCERMVAIEDEMQGNKITTAYAAAKLVQYRIFRSGDIVLLRLKSGESMAIGDKVKSSGDGTVMEYDTGDSSAIDSALIDVIAVAMEALDFTDSSAIDIDSQLFKARII